MTWLKESRLKKNLTMRDVADLIGEPHQFISKVECGERRIDVYEYVQYCEALNINPKTGIDILKS